MNRKKFLLSLPLIGFAVKSIAKPEENKAPEWIKEFAQVKTGESGRYLIVKDGVPSWAKYPLTPDECFEI